MTQIVRIRSTWGGSGIVGPGLTTFYTATSGTGLPAAVRAFFEALKSAIPTSVNIVVPNNGDLIEDTTGALAGTWSESSGGGTTTGTSSLAFAMGTGIRIKWPTSGVRNGRRVVGSTFIVPVVGAAFDTDGTLTAATRTQFQSAADALRAAVPTLRILSQEKSPGDGQSSPVTAASVPDTPSWLRSRRT